MTRPSGLAVVAYGLTAVGFIQVAVTIAPHIAATVPTAGNAAPAVGVAVALAIDVCWAALMHTTLHTYRTGQHRPAYGFAAATGLAVLASTILLAAVGHMGPWSAVPVLAALLLVADGIRDNVTVSPETAALIRARTAEMRDQRALAALDARRAAHDETLAGYAEASRLAARTASLAEIKTTVQRAEHRASRRIEVATRRYGDATPAVAPATPAATPPVAPPRDKPATPSVAVAPDHQQRLTVVRQDATLADLTDERIRELVAKGAKAPEIAAELNMHKATVYRRMARLKEA